MSRIGAGGAIRHGVRQGTAAAMRALALILLCCCSVAAETYPARSIKAIVPFSAAGVQDIVTRIIFDKVSAALGQPVIVENRPGAGGTLAMAAVAAAAADGYTVVVGDPRGSLAAAPSLYQNLGYDPRTSFEPIAMVGSSGAVLSVGKDFPAATLAELVRLAKARPGELTFGSAGNATPGHLNGERFKRLVGIDIVHVPYRMISQAVTDLMQARISFWISPVATVLQQLNTGQLRALAVAGDARVADLPDVPTIQESGFGEFDASTAYAFFAPAGTPAAVLGVLTAAIERALADADVQQRLIRTGVTPKFAPPQAVRAIVVQRVTEWADLIKAAGIKADAR
jgi:tripartite-type tricarboxylate transporter receptor subunit TctC